MSPSLKAARVEKWKGTRGNMALLSLAPRD